MSNIAIEAIRKQIQSICFDANLYDKGIADYPYAKKCSEKRKKLLREITKLMGNKEKICIKCGGGNLIHPDIKGEFGWKDTSKYLCTDCFEVTNAKKLREINKEIQLELTLEQQ